MSNLSSASLAWLRSTLPALSLLALWSFCSYGFGQLPVDLVLPSETLNSGYLVLQASDSITNSGSNFVVQDPASVTLSAGNSITLEPGFDAVATSGTATFQAVINPNVAQWQPIPVPPPPAACTDCGLNYIDGSGGTNPQAVYAPNSPINLYAYCTDATTGYLLACHISLSTTAYLYTNGHFHSNPLPPFSIINPSYGYTGNYQNSEMPVILTTTQVGQIETIKVVDNDDGDVINYDYAVGYSGLVYMDNSTIFYQTGGNTTGHGDNTFDHWITANAATGLQAAATAYINQYNPGQKVCINDMALPIGGKFDICWQAYPGCKTVSPWNSPHISHDQGTAADVAAVAGSCPANYIVNLNYFRLACIAAGSLSANTITEGNHVHCRWAY